MPTPSIKFKKMLITLTPNDRMMVLHRLITWTNAQIESDPMSLNLSSWMSNLLNVIYLPNKELKDNYCWQMGSNYDNSISLEEIVKAKLSVPKSSMKHIITEKPGRKSIPKKIRSPGWENAFGASTQGKCHCCNCDLNCLGSWHAGHILAACNGGSDTADNLRPICASCNLSMGSEHMDAFKARCYPG